MLKMIACPGYVVLVPIKRDKMTAGGIQLPDGSDPGYEDWATVASAGEESKFKIGDVVLRPEPPLYVYTDDKTGQMAWLVGEDEIAAWCEVVD